MQICKKCIHWRVAKNEVCKQNYILHNQCNKQRQKCKFHNKFNIARQKCNYTKNIETVSEKKYEFMNTGTSCGKQCNSQRQNANLWIFYSIKNKQKNITISVTKIQICKQLNIMRQTMNNKTSCRKQWNSQRQNANL